MSKTVVVHQPDFLPYLGFFHRLLQADLYLSLDHVQFARRGWTHRDKIKTRTGATWLSLSVEKCPIDTAIANVALWPGLCWRTKNLTLIAENYRRASYYDQLFGEIERIYAMPIDRLATFNIAFIRLVCRWLGIRIACVQSTDLEPSGQKSEMIANLVSAVGGTRYLSGIGAREYHDQTPFDRLGIEVVWQNFTHPTYTQQFGDFVPYLSAIDALFNCGPEGTVRLLRSA